MWVKENIFFFFSKQIFEKYIIIYVKCACTYYIIYFVHRISQKYYQNCSYPKMVAEANSPLSLPTTFHSARLFTSAHNNIYSIFRYILLQVRVVKIVAVFSYFTSDDGWWGGRLMMVWLGSAADAPRSYFWTSVKTQGKKNRGQPTKRNRFNNSQCGIYYYIRSCGDTIHI